jgi:hypothetical protein
LSYVARHFRHLRSRPPQPAPPFPPPPGSFGRMGLSIPIASGRSWLTARLPVELRLSSSRSCLATGDTTRDGPLHHDGPRHLAWPAPPHPPPRAALPHPPLRRGPSLQPPPPPGDGPHSSRPAMPRRLSRAPQEEKLGARRASSSLGGPGVCESREDSEQGALAKYSKQVPMDTEPG